MSVCCMPRSAWRSAAATVRCLSHSWKAGNDTQLRQQKLREKADKVLAVHEYHADKYKARMAAAREAAIERGSRLAEAADFDTSSHTTPPPPWVAPPPPIGIEFLVESQIKAAVARGALDNLEGKGKPLRRDVHADSWYGVDAGQSALNRMLKTAGFKPPSVEARDDMRRARARAQVKLTEAIASGAVTSSDLIQGPRGAAAREEYANYEEAVKAYNSALVTDLETYGSAWPLQHTKVSSFDDAVAAALHGSTRTPLS